ncbi:MAG TPA: Re/Si-specific NAD(P)(+) transhydrogenase subunit alpha [Polyangiaceae bacterium]|nr:Re/Si-specific NAD(P)(+) transhydrogenase subunit alpha [Polyangiaceae bacterium]
MKVGIPKEVKPGERRVAATPETVGRLRKLGFDVLVETGAGVGASFNDAAYRAAQATIVPDGRSVWAQADLVLKVQPPEARSDGGHEADDLRENGVLVSFIWPAKNRDLVDRLARRKATVLAMDQIPRITRAQKIDALSSMANIAGYRAVIEAASFYGRFFTGQMTAAGKVPPAKVLVIGAGVAGLAAIGAARGLGAVVRAFDTRAEVREQVESMGAEFLQVDIQEEGGGGGGYAKTMSPEFIAAEMALFLEQARDVDIILTTALIPGKPAPVLITEEMVAAMRPGSVIVDLAAENGGNCALTQPGQVVASGGVTIVGYVDLPSRLAPLASQLYGTNLAHLLGDMGGSESFKVDAGDPVVRGALVLKDGELMWPPPKPETPTPAPAKPAAAASSPGAAHGATARTSKARGPLASGARTAAGLIAAAAVVLLVSTAPRDFLAHLTVFVLACFVGWQVIWNVKPALHTPLMSVTNAISGIIVVGGMLQLVGPLGSPIPWVGAAAVLLACVNVAGGFVVTHRMLRMFRR